MTRKSLDTPHRRVAVFPGSFNPFTIGHANIVERALEIFDNVVICVGDNSAKQPGARNASDNTEAIKRIYANEPRVQVLSHHGLTAELVKELGACAILRGIRSVKDFEYERDMADANRNVFGVETLMMVADSSVSWVSSSLVRELDAYGSDTSNLLP